MSTLAQSLFYWNNFNIVMKEYLLEFNDPNIRILGEDVLFFTVSQVVFPAQYNVTLARWVIVYNKVTASLFKFDPDVCAGGNVLVNCVRKVICLDSNGLPPEERREQARQMYDHIFRHFPREKV